MATHNSKYYVNNEVYHFETEGKSVVIYDDNKNQLGTLNDVFLKGKTVTNVDFKSIKTTGLYSVQGLLNVPSTIPNNVKAILAVTAIGATDNPDVIFYRLIGANGIIVENTIAGNNSSGWTNGGVGIENEIKIINSSLSSLSQGISNNNNAINSLNTSLNGLRTDFNNHNHDGRYLLKNGDTVNGDLVMSKGRIVKTTRSNNQVVNFINVDQNDTAWLGDGNLNLKISTKSDVLINGKKVFTEGNTGSGSGLDADTLDGIDSNLFLRKDQDNMVEGDFTINNGRSLIINPRSTDKSGLYGRITSVDGGLILSIANNNVLAISQSNVWSNSSITIAGTGAENHYEFSKSDGRIGLYYNNNREEMGVYDWGRNQYLMAFTRQGDGIVDIPSLRVANRRFFLQNDQPSGNIPYGSVWIGF